MNYNDLTLNFLRSEYLDKNTTLDVPYKMYHINIGGNRMYLKLEDGKVKLFVGNTSFIKAVMPTSEILQKWKADMGWDESIKYMNERASFGSFMHSLYGEFVRLGSVNLDTIEEKLHDYMIANGVNISLKREWIPEMKTAVLCFAQFIIDYEVKFLVIEMPLASEAMGIATLLDCVVEMNESKYTEKTPPEKRKRILAIGDFKSGKNFYPEHAVQLESSRQMWEENFPMIPISRLFNFAPKDFTGSIPSYNYKDQTDSVDLHAFNMYLELGKMYIEKRKNKVVRVSHGVVQMGKSPKDNFTDRPIIDIATELHVKHLEQLEADYKPHAVLINENEE